ncbi:MAG: Arm DNA-binding domain-containing protein [Hyphomonadaceae bacterium]|nr:Arm DNA-binding domain-containing protein [Hyphomonadaceae bacterium]
MVETSGRKSFIIRYRADGGGRNAAHRLVTIGAYGVMTPDQARTEAKKLLGAVATGADPWRRAALKAPRTSRCQNCATSICAKAVPRRRRQRWRRIADVSIATSNR